MLGSLWNWLAPKRIGKPAARARRAPLYVEALEKRELLANVNWINPAGGDWDTPSNWSTGVVPGAADDVTIGQASSITITHAFAVNDSVHSLTINQAKLSLLSGTLSIGAASSIKDLAISGGTLAGAGDLTVNGLTTFSGGTMSGAGRTIAVNGLNISGLVSLDGRTLENDGLAKMLNTSIGSNPTIRLSNGATLRNAAGGIWDFQVDSFVVSADASANSFTNLGTVKKTATIGTVNVYTAFTNSGTVDVQAGTFDLKGGGSAGGAFTLASGTTLAFDVGTFTLNSGATVSGAGAAEFDGGTTSFAPGSAYTATGTLTVAGGLANFNTGSPITLGGLTQSGGELSGSDTIIVTGATNWFAGTMSGTGATIAGTSRAITAVSWAAGVATFTTAAAHPFVVGQTIAITGMTPTGYNGTYTIASVPTTSSFTVALAANPGAATVFGLATSGSLTLGANLTISQRSVQYAGATPWTVPSLNLFTLQNAGTFTYPGSVGSATPGLSASMTVAVVVDNNGNLQADPGDTLQYTVTITNNGSTTAQNLVFTDTLDPNTTLIPTSISYPPTVASTVITAADLANIVAAAITRWQTAGASPAQLATLKQLTFSIADLDGLSVTQAVGTNIAIDQTAANQGWFVDPTPLDDSEFGNAVSATHLTVSTANLASGHLDLLTAVMRQMGAVLGITAAQSPDLMSGTLNPGVRNLPAPTNTLSQLEASAGFYFIGSFVQNGGGFNEKWFEDRNNNLYFILPNGNLIQWDGVSMATSIAHPVANLGVPVYDDPTLLFNAQVTIAPATQTLMSSLRVSNGFTPLSSGYLKNATGNNEKWFQDRTGNLFFILPNGNLIKWNGVSLASSIASPIATLSPSVYDNPTLLFNAAVTIDPATLTLMSQLRVADGFHFTGDYLFNLAGLNEKWFQDRSGNYYFIKPNGDLFKYVGATTFDASNLPIAHLGPLVYDDPTQLFNAAVAMPASVTDYLADYRTMYGFHSLGSYYQGTFGDNEKWIVDRNNNLYFLTPTGDLLRWDGVSYATSKANPIANLGVLVFDDPTLLFNAPITLDPAAEAQLEFYRTTFGFFFIGTYNQSAFGENEKWFEDRNGNLYNIHPNGNLIKWDGVSIATSDAHPVANLGPLVYDDPTLLFNAPVTFSSAAIDQLVSLNTTYGFHNLSPTYKGLFGANELWMQDRNQNLYFLAPNGDIIKWDGVSYATSSAHPIANVGALVYDDPNLLFQAPPDVTTTLPPLGNLGVGQTEVITFQATINSSLPAGVTTLTAQGTINGIDSATQTPYTPLLTDDPTQPGTADPTRISVIPLSVFDDPDLEAAVDSTLGLAAGHIVTKQELLQLTSLTVDSNTITSLKGLEFATNLQSLTLLPSDWNVTTPLASLTPIAGLTSLKSLTLVRSGITNAQLALLGGLTGLKSLDLRYNAITSIAAIANLPALASLQIYGNTITDLSLIAGKVIALDLPVVNAAAAQNVAQLAAALYDSPIDIFQYVTNNVQNQFYTGSLKGPQATLETLAGNDWDQANLLKSLLDAAGVFGTRYVSGTAQAPVTTVEAWLGVNNSDAAGQLLATLGLHPVYVTVGGTQMLQFDHTWVEMRTSALSPWIDLDSTWKFSDAQPGVPNIVTNVPFDDNGYLITQSSAGQNAESPVDYYSDQVAAYLAANAPGSSLADVSKTGAIHQQTFTALPSATPYTVVGAITTNTTVPSTVKSTIEITLKLGSTTLIDQTLNVPDVSLNRITIEYTSAGGSLLTPKLMLDGTVVATGANITSGSAVTLTLIQHEPTANPATQTFTYSRTAGQFLAVGVDALQVSNALLNRERAAINAAATVVRDGTTVDPDQQIGAVLALSLFQYFAETDQAANTINGLTGAVSVYAGNLTSGVASSDSTVDFNWNLAIPAVPRNASLEVQNYFHQSLDLSADNTFNNARGHIINFNASERESGVLQELLNVPSMSAIQSLELANTLLIPTFTITSANSAALMPQLTLDSATKSLISAELAAGATVTVPRDPTPFNGFTGVGFISRKPNGQEKYVVTRANSGIAILGAVSTATTIAGSPVAFNADTTQTLVDGVNIASGNVVRTETDFSLPGVGLPLTFTRTYNSLDPVDHGMGAGWSFSYDDFLTFNGNGSIGWTTDTGVLHTFTPDGLGGFTAPNTIHGTFAETASGYTYRDPNGLVHQFDLTGKLTAIIDRNGNALNIAYNGSGQITTVTESGAASRSLTFTYTAGHITSISDGTGRAWTYAYSGAALTQATAPTNAVTQYAYFTDTALGGLLKQVTDPDGGVATFAYYGDRRAYQVADALGDKQIFAYNLYRNQTNVSDPRGNATVYTYNSAGNVTRIDYADGSHQSAAWTNNLQQSTTDVFGQTTSYVYDANGNLTQTTDPLGNVTTRTYEPTFNQIATLTQPGGRVTTYAYDANGNLTSITDALGNVTAMTYYANGLLHTQTLPRGTASATVGDFTTTYTYNDGGQILTIATDLPSTVTYTYDARGRMLTYTDANNHTTTYTYDLADRLLTTTDPLNHVTTNTYDAIGNLVTTTDALGRTTLFAYDLDRHLVKTTFADGTYTTGQWDAAGNLVSSTDALGRLSTNVYDNRNRVIQSISPGGASTLTRYDGDVRVAATTDANGNVTKFTYDKLGRLATTVNAIGGTTTQTYDAVGNLLTVTDPLGHTTTYQYDLLNRQTQMKDALGNVTNYTYDADSNLVTIAAPLGQTTQNTYDVRDRLIATTDALSHTTSRTYDAVGNLLTVKDPNNNVTTYTYDALNRLIAQTNPAGGATETFTYDAVGNQTSVTDFTGRTTRYTYDLHNRQVKEEWLNGSNVSTYTITYSYDAAGELTSASDPSSTYHYTYNKAGFVATADNYGTPGVPNVQMQYTYDAAGNVLSVSDLYGNVLHADTATTYDALNRATRINNTTLTYNAASELTTVVSYANSALTALVAGTAYTYDADGNITGLTYNTPSGSVPNTYSYNAAGRLTTRVAAGVTSNYTYDATGQLLTATQPSETYSYDAAGNRTGGSLVYGSGNRLLSDGTFTYAYDANGNLISQTQIATGAVTLYTWDYRDRLTSVTVKNNLGVVQKVTTYTYDMFNRRIAKSVDPDGPGFQAAVVERYVYNGAQIALQFDGNGALTHQFAYGPGGQVLTDTNASGGVVWALADNLGSIRFVLNSAGGVVDQITYNSFGAIVAETNPAANFLYGFDGLVLDRDSGLQYDGTLYYSPRSGRYISQDPLTLGVGDPNLYRFQGNNPLEA